MADWTGGYVVDLEYTRGFYRDMTPAWMATAAALAGQAAPDPGRPYTFCELACGHGISTLILAAANPHAQFWATDLNPTHIAGARALAAAAGLTNVHFFDDSFAEFVDRDLPAFDFVTLHGTYTWVTPAVRHEIVAFLKRHVKPGGLVYASYNCMPGWATMIPVRRLMMEAASRSGARGSLKQLEYGLDSVKSFFEGGLGFGQVNPDVKARVDRLSGMQKNYLVHEFMHQGWEPMYFPDVAAEFGEAKLTYVGNTTVLDMFDDTGVPEKAREFLAAAPDEPMRQLLRDFVVNRQFRSDLFVRGATPLSPVRQTRQILEQRYALIRRRDQCQFKVAAPAGEVNLPEAVYGPLLDALAEGPAVGFDLPARAGLGRITDRDLLLALRILMGGGYIQPAVGPTEAAVATAAACNRALFQSLLNGREIPVVAVAGLGSGIGLSGLDQAFLQATAASEDPARWILDQFTRNGIQVQVGAIAGEPKPLAEQLTGYAGEFRQKLLPFLRALGL